MTTKTFNVILAATNRGEIGYKNTLPWKLRGDLARFKMLTMGHTVIMGRHTYESLPAKLEDRCVIVVSKTMDNRDPKNDGIMVVSSLAEAIREAKELPGDIFVAGGASLYAAAMKFPCNLYLTTVYKKPEHGYDTVIPDFNVLDFEYEYPPLPIFETDPTTGLMELSHTYAKLYSRNQPFI